MSKEEKIEELVVAFFWEIYQKQPVMTIREARSLIKNHVEEISRLDDMDIVHIKMPSIATILKDKPF